MPASERTRIALQETLVNLRYDGESGFPYMRSNYRVFGSSIPAICKSRVVSVEYEYRGSSKKGCKNRKPGGNSEAKMLLC